MNDIENTLPVPNICYDAVCGKYYLPDDKGQWIGMNETGAKRDLRLMGYSQVIPEDELVSPLDRILNNIQKTQHVAYAAPLAGHPAGLYDINGDKILATKSPKLIEPVEGEFPLLKGILEGMFNHGGIEQVPYVYGWLKVAITSLRNQKHQLGQMLAMAGPYRSAKSLLQAIITELLGGRAAKPYSFMTGGTTFNGELFRAEHLMIEDDAESKDYDSRRTFAANIKQTVANRKQKCHGKYKDGLTLTPFWRITVSLNDNPECLLVLPPIDADIEDKIMLLKVVRREMPMPTSTPDEVEAFWDALMAELPAFVHFLINWEIPQEMKSNRFGILHYHHPELLQVLKETTPEHTLMELINAGLFGGETVEAWEGTASQLMDQLIESSRGAAAKILLRSANKCGIYLGRLERECPERVSRRTIRGETRWTIQPTEGMTPAPAVSVPKWVASK